MEDKKSKVTLYVILALNIIGVIFDIYWVVTSKAIRMRIIVSLIDYIGVIYYIVKGYKTPHGNALKYLMLLFGVNLALIGVNLGVSANHYTYVMVAAGLIVAYMAGRLNRFRENTILALVVLFLITLGIIIRPLMLGKAITITRIIWSSGFFIQWCALISGYYYRYIEHKEAGFQNI